MIEYWDLYDKHKKKIKKVVKRGDKLSNDEFHLVVNSWILNDEGEFLITQRASTKSHPLMWECTGGSVLKGDESLDAAIREIKEEIGIDVDKDNANFIGTTLRYYKDCPDIIDVWLFRCNVNIKDTVLQKDEVNDIMWADKNTILKLYFDNKFEATSFFGEAINFDD